MTQALPDLYSWGSRTWCPPQMQAQGPGPGSLDPAGPTTPGAHGPSTLCAGVPKDQGQAIQVPPDPPLPGLMDPELTMQENGRTRGKSVILIMIIYCL